MGNEEKEEKQKEMIKELEEIQKKNGLKKESEKEEKQDDIEENEKEIVDNKENVSADENNSICKKEHVANKKIFIVIYVALVILIALLITIIKLSNNNVVEENIDYEKIESKSVEKENVKEKIISSLSDEQKKIINKDETGTKLVEYKKDNATPEYIEYENLSDEEKSKLEVVPREEEIPNSVLDVIEENLEKNVEIPSKFNLKDIIEIEVEDQKTFGLCWDFTSTKSLETNMQLHGLGVKDFSEIHVDYITSNLMYGYRNIHDGGNFSDYIRYTREYGPVNNQEYREYSKEEYEKFEDLKQETIITKTVDFPSLKEDATEEERKEFFDIAKKFIMKNGSLYSTIYAPGYIMNYNYETYALYNKNNNLSNHAVSIVGWDDNFSKDNFLTPPKNDGAWIALNSWGESFGDGGYFYISYEDVGVNKFLSGVESTSLDDSLKLDDIKNENIKNYIIKNYSSSIVEKNNQFYLFASDITYLELKDMEMSDEDIKILNKFENLNYLDLSNNNIKNISSISSLKQISTLNLSENKGIIGYSEFENLNDLNISDCGITELEDLSKLNKLYSLNISKNNLKEFASKVNSDTLNQINVSYNESSILNDIKRFNKLYSLDVSGIEISDLSFLNIIDSEYGIDLVMNDCNISDISMFNELSISSLELSNNKITDVSNFNNKKIRFLDLSKNNIKNYDALSDIYYLNLKDNNISDTSILYNLDNVYSLDLSDNKISDLSFIKELDSIDTLDLSNNKISDLSTLNDIKLNVLSLDNNKDLKGSINAEISYLSLRDCDITDNVDFSSLKSNYYLNLDDNKDIKDIRSFISEEEKLVSLKGIELTNEDILEISNEKNNTYFSSVTINYYVKNDSNDLIIEDESLSKRLRQLKNNHYVPKDNGIIYNKGKKVRLINKNKNFSVDGYYGIKNIDSAKLIFKKF